MTGWKKWLDKTILEQQPRFALFFCFKGQPGLLHGWMWRQRLSYSKANILPAGPTRKQDVMSQVYWPSVFTDKVLIAMVSVPQSALYTHCSIPEARIILPKERKLFRGFDPNPRMSEWRKI